MVLGESKKLSTILSHFFCISLLGNFPSLKYNSYKYSQKQIFLAAAEGEKGNYLNLNAGIDEALFCVSELT